MKNNAAFSAPNPGEALPELVREAEELRRFDAAIRLQTQFVRVVPQTGPEGLERLAQLQEKNLQPDEAAKTWARLVQKYPRDVQVLEKAADFERAWGTPERALALLRRLRAIEPVPRPGFSGAPAFDREGRLVGVGILRHPAAGDPGPPRARLVPVEAIETFLRGHGIALVRADGGARASEAAVARVICVRK